jgi:hypothetical protein
MKTPVIENCEFAATELAAKFGAVPQPTFEAVLDKWQFAKQMMNVWQTQERELRLALFGGAVPTPKEGVNNVELSDGRICKFDHKVNRTIADPVAARDELRAAGINDVDQYLKPKYELAVGPYKKLAPDSAARLVLDKYITSKPGLPALEVK